MKTRIRFFWSYDIVKTQKWLDKMSEKGFTLTKVNAFLRLFRFEKTEPTTRNHIISYEKKIDGYPSNIENSSAFETLCHTKHYYIVSKRIDEPEILPSYEGLFNRNTKLKTASGQILLAELILMITPIILILITLFRGGITVESSPATDIQFEWWMIPQTLLFYTIIFAQPWMIYTYFKLGKTNKELGVLCGDTKSISFTIPTDTILSKEDIKKLKREGKLIKKTKIAWFYSPDKHESWLESMAAQGYHLQRMSKIGNSFYFIKGEPTKMKFHVDYQKRKGATYYSINEENGWKLYFTSVPRYFAISVWGQEYTETAPKYYSDIESKTKHARSFMLSYIVWMIPMIILYSYILIRTAFMFIESDYLLVNTSLLFTASMFLLLIVEFSYFSGRIILYYLRVRKANS